MLSKNELESKRREKLFDLFDKIKKTGGTLVIGGDFFDFWLQSFFSIPENYDDLITSLKSLYENKIDIHYVVGNHDYWDFGYLEKKCGCKVHKRDFLFELNNHKMLITHGDGVLINDYKYRLMKKIIRSSLFVFLVRGSRPPQTPLERLFTDTSRPTALYQGPAALDQGPRR